jgi:transposase InsO family protein
VLAVVDEGADVCYVRLLKDKTCALDGVREIAAEMRAATKREVTQWTFDRGTEFLNKDVRSCARDELRASTFYSNVEHPWENGLAERSFGVMFTIARALLHDAQCPNHPWGHAILHACYLRNRRAAASLLHTTLPVPLLTCLSHGCLVAQLWCTRGNVNALIRSSTIALH